MYKSEKDGVQFFGTPGIYINACNYVARSLTALLSANKVIRRGH